MGLLSRDSLEFNRFSPPYRYDFWRRFRANRLAVTGLVLLALFFLMAFLVSPLLAALQGHSYYHQDWDNINLRPNGRLVWNRYAGALYLHPSLRDAISW